MKMDTDIAKKIDVLVEMAESSLNIDTAKAELREIERQATSLKNELALLDAGKEEEKYFKASEKQVDENIKVSLESKIKKQERSIKNLQMQIDFVVAEENEAHNHIITLKEEIASSNDYITILNDRITTINEVSSKKYYQDLLSEENKKLDVLLTELKKSEKDYEEILEHLNFLNLAMEEMQEKLANEKSKLTETKANLINPSSYIDEELKELDEERIQEIKKLLTELDKRKLEIITDPVMIADEAKTLLMDDDRTSALSKVQELVTIVKSRPFMDIPSGSELSAMLHDEEEKAIDARDEFASFVDSKDYSGSDNKVIEERINYLNIEIASLEDKIRLAKEEIKNIDTVEFQLLADRLNETQTIYSELEQELLEYQEIIENESEEKTPKRRAILTAAFDKKEKELAIVKMIIENYKKDQKDLIHKAYVLETQQIKKYEEEIAIYKDEILSMKQLLMNTSKVKDVLAIENDKKKLKELDDTVKNIKHRQKYSQTPSEIFDEIEIYLGTMDMSNPKEDIEVEPDPVFHFNYDIDIPETVDEESSIEDDIKLDTISVVDLEQEDLDTKEVMQELPSIEEPERLKVINVEALNTDETNDDNSFIIGDYQEEDYVSLNDLVDSEV